LERLDRRVVRADLGLEWNLEMHVRRDVDEGPARPKAPVEGGERMVVHGNRGAEMRFHEVRSRCESGPQSGEAHAAGLEVSSDGTVRLLGFGERAEARQTTRSILHGLGRAWRPLLGYDARDVPIPQARGPRRHAFRSESFPGPQPVAEQTIRFVATLGQT